jgi:hypothetical protein
MAMLPMQTGGPLPPQKAFYIGRLALERAGSSSLFVSIYVLSFGH